MDKDIGHSNRPPMLDGSNYDDWKPRMIAFLRSLDSKVWRAVNKGWEHPTKTGEDGVSVQIPEEEWDKEKEALAFGNSKALNALFNGIKENKTEINKREKNLERWMTSLIDVATSNVSRARAYHSH